MTAIDWETHRGVICPINPTAICTCGEKLLEHTGDSMVCPHRWSTFVPADGEDFDCPNRIACEVCKEHICSEHSTQFASCVDGPGLHHLECVDDCDACVRASAEDAAEDRAIEQWKGCW